MQLACCCQAVCCACFLLRLPPSWRASTSQCLATPCGPTSPQATPLTAMVKIGLTKDLPIVVDYKIEDSGFLKYFLAPKIDDEEGGGEDGDA